MLFTAISTHKSIGIRTLQLATTTKKTLIGFHRSNRNWCSRDEGQKYVTRSHPYMRRCRCRVDSIIDFINEKVDGIEMEQIRVICKQGVG